MAKSGGSLGEEDDEADEEGDALRRKDSDHPGERMGLRPQKTFFEKSIKSECSSG